jgi:hypothetical protein
VRLVAVLADGEEEADVSAEASWSSSDPLVAEVSIAGAVVGVHATGAGATVLSATYAGLRASAVLTVEPAPLVALQFEPPQLELAVGLSQVVKVVARTAAGALVSPAAGVVFSTSEPQRLAIDEHGEVRGRAVGEATLTARYVGLTATLQVHITAPKLIGITTSLRQARLAPGQVAELVVVGVLSDDTTVDLTAGATATAPPGVQVKHSGATIIAVASRPVTGQVVVQSGPFEGVVDLEVSKVQLTDLRLEFDATGQGVTARARWADGLEADVTELARWKVSEGDATVSDTPGHRGALSRTGKGPVTVGASFAGLDAAATLPH